MHREDLPDGDPHLFDSKEKLAPDGSAKLYVDANF